MTASIDDHQNSLIVEDAPPLDGKYLARAGISQPVNRLRQQVKSSNRSAVSRATASTPGRV